MLKCAVKNTFFFNNSFRVHQLLHIVALLETGTALIIVGMLNFSLGLLLSVVIVPFAILVNPDARPLISVSKIWCFALHPLLVASACVLAYTAYTFPELSYDMIVRRALSATMDAITFSIVDSIVSLSNVLLCMCRQVSNVCSGIYCRFMEIGSLIWWPLYFVRYGLCFGRLCVSNRHDPMNRLKLKQIE